MWLYLHKIFKSSHTVLRIQSFIKKKSMKSHTGYSFKIFIQNKITSQGKITHLQYMILPWSVNSFSERHIYIFSNSNIVSYSVFFFGCENSLEDYTHVKLKRPPPPRIKKKCCNLYIVYTLYEGQYPNFLNKKPH